MPIHYVPSDALLTGAAHHDLRRPAEVSSPQQMRRALSTPQGQHEALSGAVTAHGCDFHVRCRQLEAVLSALQVDVQVAHLDVTSAARHALAHGPLLALRYAVAAVPWQGTADALVLERSV